MTRYMLDTNIISDLVRNPQGKAAKRVAKAGEDNICTSIIVAAELRYGCVKSGSKRLLKAVDNCSPRSTCSHLTFQPIPNTAEFAQSWKRPESL